MLDIVMHNVIIFVLVNPPLSACERRSCRSRLSDWLHSGSISRVKLLDDPEKIARKRFMAFLSSLRSIVKHTKSRHHSDHQKVFKLDFKKIWPPIKKYSLYICISVDSNSLRPVYMLQLFIFINIFIQLQSICDPNKSVLRIKS